MEQNRAAVLASIFISLGLYSTYVNAVHFAEKVSADNARIIIEKFTAPESSDEMSKKELIGCFSKCTPHDATI